MAVCLPRTRRSLRPRWLAVAAVWCGIATLGGDIAAAQTAPLPRDTVWYVSARARDAQGRDRRVLADSLEYGAAIFERTPAADPLSDPLTLTLRDSVRFTRVAFLVALASRLQAQRAPDDRVVLYVHGFGTGRDECVTHPAHARMRVNTTMPWVAFCWPSHGSGLTWPRFGSVFVRAYEEDTASATASAPMLAGTLDALTGALGANRLMVVGHSLGGRVVGTALTRHGAPPAPVTTPLHALAFLALDHDAAHFADTLVPRLRTRAHRLVLYTTRRDRALTISRRMHDTPRAGLAEPVPLARAGLETVDVTDGWAADRLWQRLVGNRHSIRRASAMLFDLTNVVGRGLAGDCRVHAGLGVRQSPTVWMLTPARPDTSRLSGCAPHADTAFFHALLR